MGIRIFLFLLVGLHYLGFATELSTKLQLTNAEKDWLQEHPLIRVSADVQWAPFEFYEEGNFQGIHIDYYHIIEEMLGISFEFIPYSNWDAMMQDALDHKVDVVVGMVETPYRKEHLLFTDIYERYDISIFAKKGTPYIKSLASLKGKPIGVVSGYFIHEQLLRVNPDLQIVRVRNIAEGLKKLQKDEIYVFVESIPTASFYIYREGLESIRIVGETSFKYNVASSVRNDWPVLRDILNKAIKAIPEAEKNSIYNNWITLRTQKFDLLFFLKVFIPLLLLLIVGVYWNRKLAKEVKMRKEAQKETRQAFQQLKDTQTHLVQNEKLTSIGMLTAGIAHEIKNPLNVIPHGIERIEELFQSVIKQIDAKEIKVDYSDSSEILTDKELIEEHVSYIRLLNDSVQRISEITKSINSFSRISETDHVLIDVNENLESAFILLKSQYKYNVELIKDYGDLRKVNGNPGKLSQVFVNIISNAVQAIENKGTIWATTHNDGDKVVVSIKDSGIGISEENLNKIFDSFYTSKPVGKGTGLGLAISKNIIEEHKGSIAVYSKVNEGTEFIIQLPAASG